MAVVLGLNAAYTHGITACFNAILFQYLGLALFGYINECVVSTVCNECGILPVLLLHIVLYALVVSDNHIGKTHGTFLGELKEFLNPTFPLCPAVFKAVDVYNYLLAAE